MTISLCMLTCGTHAEVESPLLTDCDVTLRNHGRRQCQRRTQERK